MSARRPTREFILEEIRRLAVAAPGTPIGRVRFTRETGIKLAAWEGIYWTSWSEALQEAGVSPNMLNQPYPEDALLQKLADLTRDLGRVPARSHLKLAWNKRDGFPAPNTFYTRFGSQGGMVDGLRRWVADRAEYADVAALLRMNTTRRQPTAGTRRSELAQDVALSDSYMPPVIASLPSLARMESDQPIEFERRVAVAFEILGLEVQRLGQGAGREPDGIAKCRQHGWAVIYDAKARAGVYRVLAPEERKFREYIER